jgi:hypothetical protein
MDGTCKLITVLCKTSVHFPKEFCKNKYLVNDVPFTCHYPSPMYTRSPAIKNSPV